MYQNSGKTILQMLISVLLLSFVTPTLGDIPQMMSYQGKVTDTGGTPVSDGTYTMRFRIYDALSGGDLEWDSGNRSIQVSGGIFNILLGESPQPSINLPFDEDYWLLVTVGGDNQSPRQRLCSVGYAYMASGLVAGTEIIGSVSSGISAVIKGTNTATSITSYGLYGLSASTAGTGVFGRADATVGSTAGVQGESYSSSGHGVVGWAAGSGGITTGVTGQSNSTNGRGVYGFAPSNTGTNYGVYGLSSSIGGAGVFGKVEATTGINAGVSGESQSNSGIGVVGWAGSTSGITYGLHGQSNSTNGRGVYGYAPHSTGTTYGVLGESSSTSGSGIKGHATATTGVNYGVHGESNSTSGRGVDGLADASSGSTYGVYGRSGSTSGTGVRGYSYATTGTTYGVHGYVTSGSSGYGVYFTNGLAGTGTKSCVVKTSQGPTLMYCQESPENWFEDFGEGQLISGRCHIDLDPLFLETVTINEQNPMHIFIQPKGSCHGTFVVPGTSGFDVVEQEEGISDIAFSYRVVAKRKGFESKRLDYCEAAENDPYLFPELVAEGAD